MNYLISATEKYRFDTEEEATTFIEKAKEASIYSLPKYNCEHKIRKQKGEIVDEWFTVTLLKTFNDEKYPEDQITVNYSHS